MTLRARIALAAVLLLAAGVRLRYFTGLQAGGVEAGDDAVYSRIAYGRLHGEPGLGSVHGLRQGHLLPLTLSYALFGVGEASMLLYPLLCSVGLCGAAFLLARRLFGERAAAIAGVAAALHPTLVYYGTEGHTDTAAAFWQAAVVLLYLSAAEGRPRRKLLLAGLLLGWAYLTKETSLALALFLAGHARTSGRRWRELLPLAAGTLAVLAAESLVYLVQAGDPLHRWTLIRTQHTAGYMDAAYATAGPFLYRLFLELPVRLLSPVYGFHVNGVANLAGLAAVVVLLRRRAEGAGVVGGWWLALALFFCLCPSSLVPFRPGFFLHPWTLVVFGVPAACILGGALAGTRRAAVWVAALAASNLVAIDLSWRAGRELADGAREARAWIERERPDRVVTDPKTAGLLDFLDGHRPRRGVFAFDQARDWRNAAVIVDKLWAEPGRWTSVPIPEELRRPPPTLRKVYDSPRLVIYRE